MFRSKLSHIRLTFCLVFYASAATAQEPVPAAPPGPASDSLVNVEILPGVQKLEFRKVDDSTQLTILAGTVKLKQGTALFYCDSCVINNRTRTFEAWGSVHINDADTAHVYASHLRYLIDKRIAFLDGGVRLTDGKGTLTTPDLEYDMTTSIGTYLHGGKVINKKTVLTSQEGYYYADLHDVYFKRNVLLTDPAYTIRTDSLLYNTQSQMTRFIAQTWIKDSSGRTIETKEGYYNLATGKAEFGQRPIVIDGPRRYTANRITSDDSTGIVQLQGNAVVTDSAQGTTIIAGLILQDRKNERTLATNKPLMIIKQDDDSIYVTADTLFSARLTDLYGIKDSIVKDTVKGTKVVSIDKKDSTNRYLGAYRNVKIFSDSLQAVSDSLFYSFKDSVFRLYQDPIVWAKESQISGDTLLLFTKNKKADKLKAFENSFLINQLEPGVYNQVKSTRLDGWFSNGNIDSVRSAGDAACIYYIQDDDSAYTGINESKSEILDSYFRDKELYKVVFRTRVTGTIWPMKDKSPEQMKLPGFRWLDSRRPKTKYDLF
ncbi:MAG: OstA family protein [Bacteroidetes bacterium]|nr:OstA family protein [Bacteroidota bacterium]